MHTEHIENIIALCDNPKYIPNRKDVAEALKALLECRQVCREHKLGIIVELKNNEKRD